MKRGYKNRSFRWKGSEAFKARREIMMEAAKRAKVLFDHFGWTWGPHKGMEIHVPHLLEIYNQIRDNVYAILGSFKREDKFYLSGGGTGRIFAQTLLDEFGNLVDIEIFFLLGRVPVEYFLELSQNIARSMKEENSRRGVFSVRRIFERAYQYWSSEEEGMLMKWKREGISLEELSRRHQRTEGAIKSKLRHLKN